MAPRRERAPPLGRVLSARRPPLAGLRVIEVGNYLAGPFCGLQLADLGTDVVKVEDPRGGDLTRTLALGTPLGLTGIRLERAGPLLGEHTREVLRELGLADAEIDVLVARGTIAEAKEVAGGRR